MLIYLTLKAKASKKPATYSTSHVCTTQLQHAVSGGRGLAISRAFARVHLVRGKGLTEIPGHVRTMAKDNVKYRAYMSITYFVVALFGVLEQPSNYPASKRNTPDNLVPIDQRTASLILRVLTPTVKALTARAAIAGLAECMESLGGVGYLDSASPLGIGTNVARLYRDSSVLSIWEGTTNVMAEDTVRVLKGKEGGEVLMALERWVRAAVGRWRFSKGDVGEACSDILWPRWMNWETTATGNGSGALGALEKETTKSFGWIVIVVLLVEDARRNGDGLVAEVARRWAEVMDGYR